MPATIAARAGAVAAGLLSLAGAAWAVTVQLNDTRLLDGAVAAQLAPLPTGLVPPGTRLPPAQSPLSAAQHQALAQVMRRDPLDPKPFNLLYADALRTGRQATARRLVALLDRLGWRYTPAQENLLFADILAGRFTAALDRMDALLRRQKARTLAFGMLSTMEAIPQVHGDVVAKLAADPAWRRDYLEAIAPQAPPAMADARLRTMQTLLRTPQGLTREEIGPSLVTLVANGRGQDAYSLWIRRAGGGAGGELLYDPDFRQAHAVSGSVIVPFEWQFGQDPGYDAEPSSEGTTISWDRRGVPIFVAQLTPVVPGAQYQLTMSGRSDGGRIDQLLSPTLMCREATIKPVQATVRPDGVRYRFDRVPAGCDMALVTVSGALDSGAGAVTITLTKVGLQRVG